MFFFQSESLDGAIPKLRHSERAPHTSRGEGQSVGSPVSARWVPLCSQDSEQGYKQLLKDSRHFFLFVLFSLHDLREEHRPGAAGREREVPAEVAHTQQHRTDSCWRWEVCRSPHTLSQALVESYGFDAAWHTGWHNVKETWRFQSVCAMIATSTDLFIMVRRCLLTFKPFR